MYSSNDHLPDWKTEGTAGNECITFSGEILELRVEIEELLLL